MTVTTYNHYEISRHLCASERNELARRDLHMIPDCVNDLPAEVHAGQSRASLAIHIDGIAPHPRWEAPIVAAETEIRVNGADAVVVERDAIQQAVIDVDREVRRTLETGSTAVKEPIRL
jgi:hypothetical protein